jgi:hypothetical protein
VEIRDFHFRLSLSKKAGHYSLVSKQYVLRTVKVSLTWLESKEYYKSYRIIKKFQ